MAENLIKCQLMSFKLRVMPLSWNEIKFRALRLAAHGQMQTRKVLVLLN